MAAWFSGWKLLAVIAVLLVWLVALGGCSGGKNGHDGLTLAQQAREMGFTGKLRMIGGPGHVGPVSFNILGIMWYLECDVDPGKALPTLPGAAPPPTGPPPEKSSDQTALLMQRHLLPEPPERWLVRR